MLRFICVISFFAVSGCAHAPRQLTLDHEIQVPKQWRGGASDPDFQDSSDIARYTSAYERGWWLCVVRYARDIDCPPDCSDSFIGGWPAETCGWSAGVADARARVEQLIRVHGKEPVSKFLSEFKDMEL
jgi:hypothetical protein